MRRPTRLGAEGLTQRPDGRGAADLAVASRPSRLPGERFAGRRISLFSRQTARARLTWESIL